MHLKGNLRRHGTTFVGRDAAVTKLDTLLATGARLITLQGAGGVGKTRLATEYALGRAELYKGGAWLCDLTDVRDAPGITRALAHALELPMGAGATEPQLNDIMGRALAARGPTLIVFDNCERLVEQTQDTIARWVADAPALRAIATSRIRLKVPGEVLLDVAPLSVVTDIEGHAEAVQLFVDRARSVCEDEWSPDSLAAIGRIVSALDGLPLAVELAAGRMGIMSPHELEAAIGDRPDLLADPTKPRGRRSLAETILGSWELLRPREQAALAQCSIFQGGFTVESAEAVLDLGGPRGAQSPSVVDVLQALRDRSLVTVATGHGGEANARRFALYETIRQFARQELESSDGEQACAARHARHFAELAVEWCGGGPSRRSWLLRTSLEQDNLLAVAETVLTTRSPSADSVAAGMATLTALGRHHIERSAIPGFMDVLRRFLAASMAFDGVIAPARVAAFELIAARCERQEGSKDYMKRIAAALELAQKSGDEGLIGRILLERGVCELRSNGRLESAALEIKQARDLARRAGDRVLESFAENMGSEVLFRKGKVTLALGRVRRASAIAREAGDVWQQARADVTHGWMLSEHGEPKRAKIQLLRAAEMCEEALDISGQYYALTLVATLAHRLGQFEESAQRFEALHDLAERLGDSRRASYGMVSRGFLLQERGDLEGARRDYERGLPALETYGVFTVPAVFAALGAIDAAQDDLVSARARFDEAERRAALLGNGEHVAAAVEVFRAVLDVALARRARSAGDLEAAAAHRAVAEKKLDAALQPTSNDDARSSLAERAANVRSAVQILRAGLDQLAPPREAYVLSVDGTTLRLPSGASVDLRKTRIQRVLLVFLAEGYHAHPGTYFSRADLVAHLWPDERVLEKAASNRLFVTIAKLRQLGLKDVIESGQAGWRIAPGTALVRAD